MTLVECFHLIPNTTRFGLQIREKSPFKVYVTSLPVSLNFQFEAIVCDTYFVKLLNDRITKAPVS